MRKAMKFAVLFAICAAGCQAPATVEQAEKRVIQTDSAPKAVGPYSQGILVNGTLYCSGQIALDPSTGELITQSIEDETHRVLQNLGAVLRAADMDYANVVRATVYLADMSNYQRVNAVYGQYFSEAAPARVAVEVAKIPKGANIEISCIAVRAGESD